MTEKKECFFCYEECTNKNKSDWTKMKGPEGKTIYACNHHHGVKE